MNSIKEKDKEKLAADIFEEVLVPAALDERARGTSFFPLRPDPEAESYYAEPTRRVMAAPDFELRAGDSIAGFIEELAALWAGEGHTELAALAPQLAELAEEMGEQEEGTEDVSAFMYVMF
jgi:hypothetical protein